MALSVKNMVGFIDGSIIKPEPASPDYSLWLRSNNLVCSWIVNSVLKNIATSVMFLDSATEVWRELAERFQQMNKPKMFQLKKRLSEHRQGQLSVTTYYTNLKIIWDVIHATKHICSSSRCTCRPHAERFKRKVDYAIPNGVERFIRCCSGSDFTSRSNATHQKSVFFGCSNRKFVSRHRYQSSHRCIRFSSGIPAFNRRFWFTTECCGHECTISRIKLFRVLMLIKTAMHIL